MDDDRWGDGYILLGESKPIFESDICPGSVRNVLLDSERMLMELSRIEVEEDKSLLEQWVGVEWQPLATADTYLRRQKRRNASDRPTSRPMRLIDRSATARPAQCEPKTAKMNRQVPSDHRRMCFSLSDERERRQ